MTRSLDAAHAGHSNIQQNDRRALLFHVPNRLRARAADTDAFPFGQSIHETLQPLAGRRLVIDDQQRTLPCHRSGHGKAHRHPIRPA